MIRKLHTVYCIFITGFATVLLFPVALLMMLLNWSRTGEMWLVANVWSQILIKSGGATVEVIGREHLDPDRPTIYVSNHQSTLDAPVLFWGLWPVPFRYVSKHTLKYVPVTGWYLMLGRYIFIDRSNHRTAVKTLDEAAVRIRAGTSIVVFPEGTRSETGAILPFKKGPFALAVKAGVAICPVTIEGTGSVMPKNSWSINPGPVKLMIGAPIDPRPFGEDREALARAVRDAIIAQSLQLGGKGGDRANAIAARGQEGIGRQAESA
ncbi:MAG: 1-acyl-sn-glycerol-3-phosphate acyltransferase [Myxococcaceae bacterium]|nr:1-acyl-sn-glycerol-3-phosphate acyltransferase [Myxococcaceae bacterium]